MDRRKPGTLMDTVARQLDEALLKKGHALCIIDGYCGAGKTTLAAELSAHYGGAAVIHMDDFFLPYDMRTPERLSTPGGNVHHERFLSEVVAGLQTGQTFTYQRFDCTTGTLAPKQCDNTPVRIVEGSYSLHPALQEAWQQLGAVTVFLSVDESEQLRRIARRAPEKLQAFVDRWIPLEKNYFQAYDIKAWAQLALTSLPREDLA